MVATHPIRLGTRGSALARWQAEHVQALLAKLGHECELVIIRTEGDRRTDVPLASIGGKGLFTEDIERRLLDNSLDCAVHSLKDVPSALPPGLVLAATLEREDPRDALVAAAGTSLMQLPHGARLGTSSLRRQAQALALRPDLRCENVRGNVDTRLRRWRAGDYDALLLAAAGLRRLGLADVIAEYLDPGVFCPSAGQGVLALECRAGDAAALAALAPLNHAPTASAITAERALLLNLHCGCESPVGAYARWQDGQLRLSAVVASPDGTRIVRHQAAGLKPESLAAEVAEHLLSNGARELL
ncbi:MAG TPA: hydroxymethylbilane synthase [Terriglobales bacterium]|jgi:hydroxymethylbilane synthase